MSTFRPFRLVLAAFIYLFTGSLVRAVAQTGPGYTNQPTTFHTHRIPLGSCDPSRYPTMLVFRHQDFVQTDALDPQPRSMGGIDLSAWGGVSFAGGAQSISNSITLVDSAFFAGPTTKAGYMWTTSKHTNYVGSLVGLNRHMPDGDYHFGITAGGVTREVNYKIHTLWPSTPHLVNYVAAQSVDSSKRFILYIGGHQDYYNTVYLVDSKSMAIIRQAAPCDEISSLSWTLEPGTLQPGRTYYLFMKSERKETFYDGSFGPSLAFTVSKTTQCMISTRQDTPESVLAFLNEPSDAVGSVGGTHTFSCKVSAPVNVRYQWLKDGRPLINETSPVLILKSLKRGDSGKYSLAVYRRNATITSREASLSFPELPVIIRRPLGTEIVAGDPLTMRVAATGTGPFQYEWFFNSKAIPGQTNAMLAIANFSTSNVGRYHVVVRGGGGAVTSPSAKVNLLGPPVIVIQPGSATCMAGQSLRLSVGVVGGETITYQWYKDGIKLIARDGVQAPTTSSLLLTNAKSSDSGSYTVVAVNRAGMSRSKAASVKVVR